MCHTNTNANYELKYCERCGGLGLRRVTSNQSYCRRCEAILARFSLLRLRNHQTTQEPDSHRPAAVEVQAVLQLNALALAAGGQA